MQQVKGQCATAAAAKCICQSLTMSRDRSIGATKRQCALMFYAPAEPEVVVLVLAGATAQITQITSLSELHNRISECQGSHSLPPSSHWLWSGGTDVRGRGVAMEMGATVAFQEDGSWQNEAEHQQRRRIGQVKDSR